MASAVKSCTKLPDHLFSIAHVAWSFMSTEVSWKDIFCSASPAEQSKKTSNNSSQQNHTETWKICVLKLAPTTKNV